MKVLIVEPDLAFGEFLKDSLSDLGYFVALVACPEEACQRIPEMRPEVTVCSHSPPILESIDCVRKIKACCPECHVVIHTPSPTLELALAAVNEHVQAVIPKRAELPDLLQILEEVESQDAERRKREDQHSRLVMEYARLKRSYDELKGKP